MPVLTFLNVKVTEPIISFCDNSAAVTISERDLSTKRMKHVRTRMAYLQEQKDDGFLVLVHLRNDAMVADIGTKVLSPADFHRFRIYLVWD